MDSTHLYNILHMYALLAKPLTTLLSYEIWLNIQAICHFLFLVSFCILTWLKQMYVPITVPVGHVSCLM